MEFKLDDIDIMIISALQQDGRMSIRDLGKIVGISHTAIRKRLRKLPIKITALFSKDFIKGIVLVIGRLRSSSNIENILEKFYKCPRMIMFASSGSRTYIAMMIAEEESVIDCISLDCAIKMIPEAEKVEVYILDRLYIPDYLYLKIPLEVYDVAPCGRDCLKCRRFREGTCPGCPAVRYYRGCLRSSKVR